jgi:T5orf172 domain
MLVPEGVRDELSRVLDADTSGLGSAHRTLTADPTFAVFPYYRQLLRAILDGVSPTAITYRLRTAEKVRMILTGNELSDTTQAYLNSLLDELEGDGEAPPPPAPSTLPSIYVYTLPNYWNHPVSPDGRTWLKVGCTSGNPRERVAAQGKRTTGLPEDPILLRVYEAPAGSNIELVEQMLHSTLIAVGHQRQTGQASGKEWFLTSLMALDVLTSLIGLMAVYEAR